MVVHLAKTISSVFSSNDHGQVSKGTRITDLRISTERYLTGVCLELDPSICCFGYSISTCDSKLYLGKNPVLAVYFLAEVDIGMRGRSEYPAQPVRESAYP